MRFTLRRFVAGLALGILCLTSTSFAQTTAVLQAPDSTTPGFDGTWLDGFSSGNTVYGANNQIRAGRNGTGVNGVARGLLRFDADTLYGRYSAVTAISLELTTAGFSTSTTGGTLELYALPSGDSGWSTTQSSKNQKNQAYAYAWAATSADANGFKTVPTGPVLATATYAVNQSAGQKITFTFTGSSAALTSLLDDIIEARCGGFLLKAQDESLSASDVYFHSSGNSTLGNRPKLSVTYTPGYKVMGNTEADTFLTRQRTYFGSTWDTSVSPNRLKESDQTYEMDRNARYAHSLLDTGIAANFTAAEGIITFVRSQQILNPGLKTEHGHIRYKNTNTSAATSNPVLHDFCTLTLLSIKYLHYAKLSPTAQADLDAMLPLAITWTRENRRAGVLNITNQETASWAVLLLGGQAYSDAAAISDGTYFWGQTWTYVANTNNALAGSPNITEFNSPTYQFVTLENLALLKRYLTNNATQLSQARTYYRWIWDEMARHYHRPTQLFAGPFSRSYSDFNGSLGGSDYSLAYGISNFKNGAFGFAFSSTLGPHSPRILPEFMPFFNDALPAARTDTDTFFHGPATPSASDTVSHQITNHGVVPIIGRTYLHPSYTAASLNFGKAGQYAAGVKRPVLITWSDGSAGNAIAISLQTVLNTGDSGAVLAESSRPVIFTSQEDGSPNILAGVTWSQNLNDPQVDYTNPTSSTFTASDLRIRFSVARGNSTPPSVSLPVNLTDPVAITFNGVTTTVKLAYQDFSGFTPYWTTSASGNIRTLDLVIHSGTQQTFNLAALARFSAAFAITTSTSGLLNQSISTAAGTGSASISCGANLLMYPTQPDTIHVLARNYRDLLQSTPLGTPVNLSASASGANVNLSWTDRANAETGVQVERRTGAAGSWAPIGTAAANASLFTDSSASAATEYWYRARAVDASTQGSWSVESAVITNGQFSNPSSISATQAANASANASVTLSNVASVSQAFSVSLPGGNGAYSWSDGTFPGGEWQEISSSGTKITSWGTSVDDDSVSVSMGLSFPFYGASYSSVRVHSNGYLAFNSATGSQWVNLVLPQSSTGATAIIACLWDDLYVDPSASVYTQKIGNDFIVQWQNIRAYYPSSQRATFQCVLKSDGRIIIRFKDNTIASNSYTIGLNNAAGNLGPQVVYNSAYLPATGNAIYRHVTFTPPVNWLQLVTTNPLSVAPAGTANLTFSINSNGLADGVYNLDATVSSDLSRQPIFTIPVQLTVGLPATPPAAPSSLAISTVTSSNQLNLTWTDNASNESGFKLERSSDGSTGWTQIATPAANATSYTDAGLAGGTLYFYRLRATNTTGDSGYSNNASAATLPVVSPPAAPSALAVSTVTSSTQLTLTWTDNASNETGFKLEYSVDGLTGWTQIATPAANVTSYTHTGLNPSSTHYYRILATNSGGDSAYSDNASGTTLTAPVLAFVTTNASVAESAGTVVLLVRRSLSSVGSVSVAYATSDSLATAGADYTATSGTLTWAEGDIADKAITIPILDDLVAEINETFTVTLSSPSGGAQLGSTTAIVTVLASDTPVSFTRNYRNGENGYTGMQGRFTSSFGGGTSVGDAYIASLAGQGRFIVPIRVNNLALTSVVSVEAIRLTLKVSSNTLNGAGTLALVFNNRGANSVWTENGVTQNTLNGSTAWTGPGGTMTQAGSGVAPFAASGAWDLGSGAANNGMPLMATAVVDNSTAVNSTITFNFTGLSAAERLELITLFNHNYASGTNTAYGQTYTANPGLFLGFSATSTYSTGDIRFYGDNDTTVANRPQFSLDYSTPPVAPNPPSALAISTVTSSTQLTLTWTDNADNETGFKLERSLDGTTGWTQIAAPAANATTHTDTGLSPATAYFYRILATNTGGDSAYSNMASAATFPVAPNAPSALAVGSTTSSTQLTLTWTDNADNETGFKLERSPDGTAGWTQIAAPAANAITYTDTAIAPGATYFYRIRCTNTGGDSAYTASASGTTWTLAQAWFAANGLPTGTSISADSDGDGVSNLLEYALGGNPVSAASAPAPALGISNSGGTFLTFTFTRATNDTTYIVQGSSDLSIWTDLTTNPGTFGQSVTFVDSVDLSTSNPPRRFLRLKVNLP